MLSRHTQILALGFLVFVAYALTAAFNSDQNIDAISTFLVSWKIAWHQSILLPEFVDTGLWITDGPRGALSARLPGASLFAVPFYQLLGTPEAPTFYPAAIAASFATTGGVWATLSAMRRVVSLRIAVGAALLLAFGTGAWTTAADALWTHGPNMFWLGLAILALSRDRHAWAGLALAAGIFTRPHLAFAAAVVGLWLAWRARSVVPALRVAATSSIGVAALVVWNGLVWGRWHPLAGGYQTKIEAATSSGTFTVLERWAGTFVSTERGVLVYSPFLLLLLPGLLKAWRAAPAWVQASSLGGLAYLAAQLQQNGFGGGHGFVSNRLVLETLTLSAPLLTLSWTAWTCQTQRRRLVFAVLVWVAVFQHAVGAFVGSEYGGIRNHWTTYVIGERLAEGTRWELAGLVAVMAVTTWLLLRVVRHGSPSDDPTPVSRTLRRPAIAGA